LIAKERKMLVIARSKSLAYKEQTMLRKNGFTKPLVLSAYVTLLMAKSYLAKAQGLPPLSRATLYPFGNARKRLAGLKGT